MDKHNTDATMKKLWLHLSRDARSACPNLPVSSRYASCLINDDIATMREISFSQWFGKGEDPHSVKWVLQLSTFFKRYRFKNDPFSTDALSSLATRKFADDQERIAKPLDLRTQDRMVLNLARKYVSEILGTYNEEEHHDLCQFSRHANLGVPYRDSYLDKKAKSLSGTNVQRLWFAQLLPGDPVLNSAVTEHAKQRMVGSGSVFDALVLAKVPKSWKSLRTMLPNTVIGSFYSHGMGELIRLRLLGGGINIKTAQMRHRMLAKRFSVNRSHVTADLSSASDSFNRELVRRLLPAIWYKKIVFGLPRHYIDSGTRYSLQSIMTMGMGHTFPLQTLLFTCLLRAVKTLLGSDGLISVYGDDLIYPRAMHSYVVDVFKRLNLRMNTDKTFVSSYFRESCGGDYYRGFDVRPFSPQGETQVLSRNYYAAFLYKLYNGLLLRWDAVEVPQALHFLLTEIANAVGTIHQVPSSFPADAGVQVSRPLRPGIIPWTAVGYDALRQCTTFKALHWVPKGRVIDEQYIYYWDTLRQNAKGHVPGSLYTDVQPKIRWKSIGKARNRVLVATEPAKGSVQLLSQTGHTSAWS